MFQSSVTSAMACGHVWGSTTNTAPSGSPWNRVSYQGCVFVPLLFNIIFAGVMTLGFMRFEADNGVKDVLVDLKEKPGEGQGGTRA